METDCPRYAPLPPRSYITLEDASDLRRRIEMLERNQARMEVSLIEMQAPLPRPKREPPARSNRA
jgi:hypothetical protein